MLYRSFRDYIDKDGVNIVQTWLGGLSKKHRAEVQVQLRYLQDQATPSDKKLKILSDEHDQAAVGLWELRFTFEKRQHRPLLFKGPHPKEMTILYVAYEKGDRWEPQGALAIAQGIMNIVEAQPARSVPHDWR